MEFLSLALTWIPRVFLFLRERLTIAGARGITFRVREHEKSQMWSFAYPRDVPLVFWVRVVLIQQ